MKLKKCLAAMMMLVLMLAAFPCMSASALSDVDFTINVDTDTQYISGDTITANIEMKTQTDNGYVELEALLTYDADSLTCITSFEDVDGYSALITDEGLLITYSSPSGTVTPIDTYVVVVEFAVKTGVASSTVTLELQVEPKNVYGIDANGNKEAGLLTVSAATPKNLTIVETNEGNVGTVVASGGDANFYFTTTPYSQSVDNDAASCAKPGTVVAFIFVALVVFAAGVVVGFILCQKRMNEDGYGMMGAGSGTPSYGGMRSSMQGGYGGYSGYDDETLSGGRNTRSPSIYEDEEDVQPERLQPRRPVSRPVSEDDGVDTSYFGRAAESSLGSSDAGGFEEDDDSFPDQFIPRRYSGVQTDDSLSGVSGSRDSFNTLLGGHSRRERNDDGYGSFSMADDEGGDDDFRSDRRRYR